eukprot:scaffold82834_cov59-Attheya_sp.AAC.3
MAQSSTLFTHLDHSPLIHAAILKANKTMNYGSGKGPFSSLSDASNSRTRSSSSDASIDRDMMVSAHLRRNHEWHGSFFPFRKLHYDGLM